MRRWYLVGLVVLTSCSEKRKPLEPPDEPPPQELKEVPLTKEWFAKRAAIPAGLPALGDPGVRHTAPAPASPDALVERTRYRAVDTNGRITALIVDISPDGVSNEAIAAIEAMVAEAWGPGEQSIQRIQPSTDQPKSTDMMTRLWFDPEVAMRVTGYTHDGEYHLRFEKYLPVAKLLGTGPDVAYFDRGLFGKSYEELKTLYPEVLGSPTLPTEYGPLSVSVQPPDKVTTLRIRLAINSQLPEQFSPKSLVMNKWDKPLAKNKDSGGLVVRKQKPYVEVIYPEDRYRGLGEAVQLLVADPPPKI